MNEQQWLSRALATMHSGQSVKIKDTVDGTFFCGFKLI